MRTFISLFVLFATLHSSAQLSWEEVDIPMSDGQSLKGDIYLPDNWTSGPVVLIQTPYNKNLYHFGLPIGIGQAQSTMGYALVILDWRGFWNSTSAAYQGAPTMGEDGYDAVEWIAEQPWCDGNVGTWGPSALGKVQFSTARQHPPHLRCIVPVVAASQTNYTEYYPGGSYRVEYLDQLSQLGFGLAIFAIANPYFNTIWSVTENINFYPDEIEVPALMIAGWYDHNIDLQVKLFEGLQNESPIDVREKHRFLIGPWVHGGHGTANPGSGTQGELNYPSAVGWNHSLTWQFLDFYLKGIENGMDDSPAVQYFQMGEDEWLQNEVWPPEEVINTNLYFHQNGSLSPTQPTVENGSLSFEYDPNNPSPTIGGPTLRNDLEQGPYDQTDDVESRNDILVFTSEVLMNVVELKGKAKVNLKISSDALDTDFAIRLCDVYPDGRSMLVNDGIFRMRFKNGYAQGLESFLSEGEIYDCTIELPHTALTFLQGHKIRVDVTSSNYPRFNRNMNNGEEMYPNNNGDTLVNVVIAENTIHTSSSHASYLELPLIGGFPTTMIEEPSLTSEVMVYPNPAIDKVRVSKIPQNSLIQIVDSKGSVMISQTSKTSEIEIDLTLLPTGIYNVVINHESLNETIRLLKN